MRHEFDLLREWAALNDAQLERVATDEAIARLTRIEDLLTETPAFGVVASRKNFATTVRHLYDLYREGAWQLGEAIIEASELADKADYDDAMNVYERFLSNCKSKFHRDIARSQLRRVKDKASR
jgi:hypothetical protein